MTCIERINRVILYAEIPAATTRDEKTRSNVREAARVAKQDTRRRQNERNIAFPRGVTCQIGLRKSYYYYGDDGCGSLNTTSPVSDEAARGRRKKKRTSSTTISVIIGFNRRVFRRPTAARGGRHRHIIIVLFFNGPKNVHATKCESRQLLLPTYMYIYI